MNRADDFKSNNQLLIDDVNVELKTAIINAISLSISMLRNLTNNELQNKNIHSTLFKLQLTNMLKQILFKKFKSIYELISKFSTLVKLHAAINTQYQLEMKTKRADFGDDFASKCVKPDPTPLENECDILMDAFTTAFNLFDKVNGVSSGGDGKKYFTLDGHRYLVRKEGRKNVIVTKKFGTLSLKEAKQKATPVLKWNRTPPFSTTAYVLE